MINTPYSDAVVAYIEQHRGFDNVRRGDVYAILLAAHHDLLHDVQAHLVHGWVLNTPEHFLLARPVRAQAAVEHIINPWSNEWAEPEINCWHIHLASGNPSDLMALRPYDLPFVSWERRDHLHIHPTQKLLRRLGCAYKHRFETADHGLNPGHLRGGHPV